MEPDDELLGLLGQLDQAAVRGAIRLLGQDEEGGDGGAAVPGHQEDQEHRRLVGPTTAELESIKELIQFDHEYLKPLIDAQNNCPKNDDSAPMTKHTAQIATDTEKTGDYLTQIGEMDTTQSFKTECEDEMDLLLSMGTDKHNFDDFETSSPLNSDASFTCDLKELIGLVSSTTDFDSHSLSGKSDCGSAGSDSGISDSPRSPFSDDGGPLGSPGLGDGLWEESFTDLFPSLDL